MNTKRRDGHYNPQNAYALASSNEEFGPNHIKLPGPSSLRHKNKIPLQVLDAKVPKYIKIKQRTEDAEYAVT